MTFKFVASALALALATCAPQHPAAAEAPAACAPYAELAEALQRRYGETLRFRAEENRGFALEFFAHGDGSWTLVMRQGDRACAIAAGAAWRERPAADNAL